MNDRLVVGVEDDKDGSLRMYVGARHTNIHTHIDDEKAKQRIKDDWGNAFLGHLVAPVPSDALCDCPESNVATVTDNMIGGDDE